ncbi:Capsule assembly protein Wzi [Gemmatirosa kalamazoonensis]|uniref:Capsule assembly protein Wzi n=1 Tax=Gemmatirosa kalamazoonensis TaxID=861299 RepID=W0RH13_9BACT|nr:Capsule assembly protein Wzi [Gemmatirosa kalamazoonensis]
MPALAAGQPAATVSIDDPIYGLVDRLLARVPVPGAVVGQRPYSRRELARIARAVAATAPSDAPTARLLATLVAAIGDTAPGASRAIRLRALESAALSAAASDVAPRAIPGNGLGSIDARTAPPLDARGGRPAVHGVATTLETSHVLGIGGGLALVAQPRLDLLTPTAGDARGRVVPQRLVARGVWHNAALQTGVDAVIWGQQGARSLQLSANAPPLRAVTLGTDTAVTLPWVLRVLGRVRAQAIVADLGRGQNFPHAKLAGYKVTLMPSPRLEIGSGLLSQYGGHGAPPLNLEQRFVDLFPYLTWIHPGSSRSRDKLASNKIAGVDARLRVPELAGLSVAWDGEIDDFEPSRLPKLLWEDGAHVLGVRFDALRPDGSLALDLRLHHTGLRLFEHAQFTSGVTYQDAVLGDPLGPHAGAGYATLEWRPSPLALLTFGGALERRDPSLYSSTTDPDGSHFRLVRVRSLPVEQRARLEVGARRDALGALGASLRVGVDRVTNEDFAARAARWRPFAEAGLRLRR